MTALQQNYGELHQKLNAGLKESNLKVSIEGLKSLSQEYRQMELIDDVQIFPEEKSSGLESKDLYDEYSDQWDQLYQKNKLH